MSEHLEIDSKLFIYITASFQDIGFKFAQNTLRGALFLNGSHDIGVMIDYQICNQDFPYNYSEYTREQNDLMHEFESLYRLTADDISEFSYSLDFLNRLLRQDFEEGIIKSGGERSLTEVDPTIPEAYFERAFIDCYGRESLNMVQREYPVIDVDGQTRWVDYYIRTKNGDIGIEKDGELYHHPILIGKERYNKQLIKQNSLIADGIKVFRWSLSSMQFTENFYSDLKQYLGQKDELLLAQKVMVSRNFVLFDHQEKILDLLEKERTGGKNSFLVVLPTGTGKTEVLIADYTGQYKAGYASKCLVIVPSRQLRNDHIDKFKKRISDHEIFNLKIGSTLTCDVVIQTYAWMSRHYHTLPSDYFDYLAVDEAHHAVAPTIRKALQHFDVSTLIGLTATDKRLDNKKLSEIFGSYESDLSLKEAIEADLLVPIKAFRLRSNIDLSNVRFNGKDYFSSDLQKHAVVPSRDQLVVDMLLKYFVGSKLNNKQGIIFCVSVKHANSMAKLLKEHGISASCVSGKERKSELYIDEYQLGKIQFLTTCSLLNEGWDSPRTSVIVMARPTMSQVLYTQQLGRGTRKHPDKEALYVIDVVDNYGGAIGFNNTPWSIHALLGISDYMPWGNILNHNESNLSDEEVILSGLYEKERLLEKINIFTFENEYPDHISEEQLARELFVSTGTVKNWVRNGKITPTISIPVGRTKIHYFAQNMVDEIIHDLKLKKHDDSTQYEDFFQFIEEGDYTMSYKIIMVLSMFNVVDRNGECDLDTLLDRYIAFYRTRVDQGLAVDRVNCPYDNKIYLEDRGLMKKSLLQNPFEKFERKRFMYHCKDLNHIAFSINLWNKINNPADLKRIKNHLFEDLLSYYSDLDGIPDENKLKKYWVID